MRFVHLFTLLSLSASAAHEPQRAIVEALARRYLPEGAHLWFLFLFHPQSHRLITDNSVRVSSFAGWFVAHAERLGIPRDAFARLFTLHPSPPHLLDGEDIGILSTATLAILGAYKGIPEDRYPDAFRRLIEEDSTASTFAARYWRKNDGKRFLFWLFKFAEGMQPKVYTVPELAEILLREALVNGNALSLRKGILRTEAFTLSRFATQNEVASVAHRIWNEWNQFDVLEKTWWALHAEKRIYDALLPEIRSSGHENIQALSRHLRPIALARVIDDLGVLDNDELSSILAGYSAEEKRTVLALSKHLPLPLGVSLLETLDPPSIHEVIVKKPIYKRYLSADARARYKQYALEALDAVHATADTTTVIDTFLKAFSPTVELLGEIGRLRSTTAVEVFLHYLDLAKNDLDMEKFSEMYKALTPINKGLALAYSFKNKLFPEKFILSHFKQSDLLSRAAFISIVFPKEKANESLTALKEKLTPAESLRLATFIVQMRITELYDTARELLLFSLKGLSDRPEEMRSFVASIPRTLMDHPGGESPKQDALAFLNAVLESYAPVGDELPDNLLESIATFSRSTRKQIAYRLARLNPRWQSYAGALGFKPAQCREAPERFIEKSMRVALLLQEPMREDDTTLLDELVDKLTEHAEAGAWVQEASERLRQLINAKQVKAMQYAKRQASLYR